VYQLKFQHHASVNIKILRRIQPLSAQDLQTGVSSVNFLSFLWDLEAFHSDLRSFCQFNQNCRKNQF